MSNFSFKNRNLLKYSVENFFNLWSTGKVKVKPTVR